MAPVSSVHAAVGAIHESPVLGSVTGPVAAGAIWDRWQTYEPLLWGLVVMFFLAGIFYSLLEKPWVRPTPQ